MTDDALADVQRRYDRLRAEISHLGMILAGTVVQRFNICGTPACRCRTDPALRHGPYYQYTRKIGGKTTTRNLTPAQAARYQPWIANPRPLPPITPETEDLPRQAH